MICTIMGGDLRDHGCVQFEPLHEQSPAVQLHVPVVWQSSTHTLPEHEHELESVQVSLQRPLGSLHCASQSSVPLQVKLQLGSAAEQLKRTGSRPVHADVIIKRRLAVRNRFERVMVAASARRVPVIRVSRAGKDGRAFGHLNVNPIRENRR